MNPPRPRLGELDFSRQPFLVIRETTRACALACRHCRAEAVPHRDPRELGADETTSSTCTAGIPPSSRCGIGPG